MQSVGFDLLVVARASLCQVMPAHFQGILVKHKPHAAGLEGQEGSQHAGQPGGGVRKVSKVRSSGGACSRSGGRRMEQVAFYKCDRAGATGCWSPLAPFARQWQQQKNAHPAVRRECCMTAS